MEAQPKVETNHYFETSRNHEKREVSRAEPKMELLA
jgi:hypothetical protein